MNGIDPLAAKYSSVTPYNFSFNNPVTFADPTGAILNNWQYTYDDVIYRNYGEWVGNYNDPLGEHITPGSSGDWAMNVLGNQTSYQITVDFNQLADGVYTFGFSNGQLNSFGMISNDVVGTMSESFLRQVLGLDPYKASPERQILLQSSSGEFAQRGGDSGLVVPYTNISYSDYRAGQAKNGRERLASQIWNHPLTRFLTGDAISLSLDIDAFIPWGLDIEPIGVIIPLRGRDAFNFYGYSDVGGGFGFDLSVSGQFGKYYFLGNANDLTIDYFQGPRVEANVAVTLGLDAGLGLSYSPTRTGYGLIKASSSVGVGVPVPFPVSGNVNGGYTHIWK